MEIQLNKEEFISILQIVNSVADKNSVKPILSNFVMKTQTPEESGMDTDCVEYSVTDYDITIIGRIPAKVIIEGNACVSARKMLEICREFQEEEINIQTTEQMWIYMRCGKANLRLPTLDVGLYPHTSLDELPEQVVVPRDSLKKYFDYTHFAVGMNESRRSLMGVCMTILEENQVRWLATDGHRLARVTDTASNAKYTTTNEVIIPRKTMQEVLRGIDMFDDMVAITFDDRSIQFSGSNLFIKSRLIEGKFPNVEPIIPKDCDITINISREQLASTLKMVSLMTTEKVKPVKFTFENNTVILESEKTETGEVDNEIPVVYDGQPLAIGFNVPYFLEVLNVLPSDEVKLLLKNASSPCVIMDMHDKSYIYVIMPLRLEW